MERTQSPSGCVGLLEAAWHALGDGYRVEVRIVIWLRDNVLRVPIGSLFRRNDEWALFVVEGGRARERTVTIRAARRRARTGAIRRRDG